MKRAAGLFLLFCIFLLGSCGGAIPRIGQVIWQVNYLRVPTEGTENQELSVFLLIEEEDGIGDIESIYIIHDESELFWKLDSGNWIQQTLGGKNWFGSNSIRMNDMTEIPSGGYRTIVLDRAGERDSREFNISKEMLAHKEKVDFPGLTISQDIRIISDLSDNTLWIYDENMEILKKLKIISGSISMDIIMGDTSRRARWLSIYSYDPESGLGYIQGPYEIEKSYFD